MAAKGDAFPGAKTPKNFEDEDEYDSPKKLPPPVPSKGFRNHGANGTEETDSLRQSFAGQIGAPHPAPGGG